MRGGLHSKPKESRLCPWCGKVFQPQTAASTYCSTECMVAARNDRRRRRRAFNRNLVRSVRSEAERALYDDEARRIIKAEEPEKPKVERKQSPTLKEIVRKSMETGRSYGDIAADEYRARIHATLELEISRRREK